MPADSTRSTVPACVRRRPVHVSRSLGCRALRQAGVLAVLVASASLAGFVLPEPTLPIYRGNAITAGGGLEIDKDTTIVGDLHSNQSVMLDKDVAVQGSVSAVGSIDNRGTVTGALTAGAPAAALPFPLDATALEALADRVLTGDRRFDDAIIDDVVFVDGSVRFEGQLTGTGTVIARGDIEVRKGSGAAAPPAGMQLSLIAFGDLDVDKDRALRGALVAQGMLRLDKNVVFEGVIVGGGAVEIKKDGRISFLDVGVADDLAPSIEMVAPGDQATGVTATPEIVIALADDGAGVDPASVSLALDGVDRTADASITTGEIRLQVGAPLADGLHTVDVDAADNAGNMAGARFRFGVGTVEPLVLSLNQPLADSIFASPELVIAAGYASGFGVDLGSLRLSLDGADIDLDDAGQCEVRADAVRCTVPSPGLGAHTAAARIADALGSVEERSAAFTLIADAAAPTISFLAPAAAVLVNVRSPQVDVVYADADAGIDVESVELLLDGVVISNRCGIAADAMRCTLLPLDAGSHDLEARVRDRVGNAASAAVSFELVLDATLPAVTIAQPADGALVNTPTVVVEGTVSDASGIVAVTVAGLEATRLGATFSAEVPLVPGNNPIVVEVIDGGDNLELVQVDVVRIDDDAGPSLQITAPAAGSFVAEARPLVDVSFEDANGVDPSSLTLTQGGAPLAADCAAGELGGRCSLLEDLRTGSVDLAVSVADSFGNTTSQAVSFFVDPQPIVVGIETPAAQSITTDETVLVAGTATPDVTGVVVNGVAAQLAGGSWSAEVPLREGTNVLVAQASKASGITGSGSVEITRDVAAPIVRIDSPAESFLSVNPSVDVSGLVNDVVDGGTEATVSVNGLAAEVIAGTFLVRDVPLLAGDNVIEAVATDAAGNSGRHAVSVRFDQPLGPRIEIAGGAAQLGAVGGELSEPLTVVVKDNLGVPLPGKVVRFAVSRNSGTLRRTVLDQPARIVSVPTDGAGRAAVRLTLGDTTGAGNNRVTASIIGAAGEVVFAASAIPGPPDNILMANGDNQRGAIGQALPLPLEALVIDGHANPVPGVAVSFTVARGAGSLDGEPTVARTTDADGMARAALTLGSVPARNATVVLAQLPDTAGVAASFTATALAPGDPAATTFSGVVLDNSQLPIPGAIVSIAGATSAVTDAAGRFQLAGVPPGHIGLDIDPSASPRPERFPPLHFETLAVAGVDNALGQPILLPAVDAASTSIVGGSADVTLEMPGVAGLTLTVFAGSATFPDGSREGELSISQVQLDKVPMAPPNGSVFMPPAWTLQPAGVVFDPPARLTIANDGLAPGRLIDIFQFDHEINRFINVGRGTVDEEGAIITSDPGFGITRSGWGGCGQPPPPNTCTENCKDTKCTEAQCIGSTCVQRNRPGRACDDNKFCTRPDTCQGSGACKGDPVKDREGASIQVTVDIRSALGGLIDILQRFEIPVPNDFAFFVNGGSNIVCCESKEADVRNWKVSVGLAASFDLVEKAIPGLGIPLPFGLPDAGVVVSAALAGTAQGTFQLDKCAGMLTGSATGQITLNGTVGAQLVIPKTVKVAVGGTTGLTGGLVAVPAGEEILDVSLTGGWTGITVSGTVELFDGQIEFTGNIVLVEPQTLGGNSAIPFSL